MTIESGARPRLGTFSDAATSYRAMRRIRRFEEWVLELHGSGEIVGSVHLCIGQEAIPVGACRALGLDDRVLTTYRGHGWALALGVPPAALFAEMLGRETGTNGGRAGSAYLSAPPHRLLGENSIVGAGLPIGNGVALAMKLAGGSGVALVDFGDGATNQGAAHEALVFAVARTLPIVFLCENNGWSEMTPITATVPVALHGRAAGYGLPSQAIDGNRPHEVYEAVAEAIERAANGDGPSFIEAHTTRLEGHYQADLELYRPADDKRRAIERDPLHQLVSELEERIRVEIDAEVEAELGAAVADARAAAPAVPAAAGDDPYRAPKPLGRTALPDAASTEMTYGAAINSALHRLMRESPDSIFFGEDVAIPGGVFGVSRRLLQEFGPDRVFDTPISESAIIGAAVGASISGLRPIVEVMWSDFLLVALDQLVNQAANVHYLSQGTQSASLVLRTQQGATPGSCAQHSQSLEALLAHIPGLRVGMPATAQDAYEMTIVAYDSDDPVVLIEARSLYPVKGLVEVNGPTGTLGQARLRRRGTDAVVISWGAMVNSCVQAAEALDNEGLSVSVLDLRWLSPIDIDSIVSAVSETSRAVVVHEANRTGGFGAEVVSQIIEGAWDYLDAPPLRLATPDVRMPSAPSLRAGILPDVTSISSAVRVVCAT